MKKLQSLSGKLFEKMDNNSLQQIKGGRDVQTYVCTGCKDGTTANDGTEDDGDLSMLTSSIDR